MYGEQMKATALSLSPQQRRLLALAASRTIGVRAAAQAIGVRTAAVSDVRNNLRRYGLVENWKLWDDPITLTDEGRQIADGLKR